MLEPCNVVECREHFQDSKKMSLDALALKNLCLWCEFQSCLLFIISLLLKNIFTALHFRWSLVGGSTVLSNSPYNRKADLKIHHSSTTTNLRHTLTIQACLPLSITISSWTRLTCPSLEVTSVPLPASTTSRYTAGWSPCPDSAPGWMATYKVWGCCDSESFAEAESSCCGNTFDSAVTWPAS